MSYLKKIISMYKEGIQRGIYSVCSANEFVIEALFEFNLNKDMHVLIESTANQVNQYGGYAGMTPQDFKNYIFTIAKRVGFPQQRIILGGDHLGPYPWRREGAQAAMEKAKVLIEQCIKAGYCKLHIDTSMILGDDEFINDEIIAQRTAILINHAEDFLNTLDNSTGKVQKPLYVIGSEVPTPGGIINNIKRGRETKHKAYPDYVNMMEVFNIEFIKNNIEGIWENIIALVVDSGADFDSTNIYKYISNKNIINFKKYVCDKYPYLFFEAHSTDYQPRSLLRKMKEDGFIILKVGPALTFAFREAVFMLNILEKELMNYKNLNAQFSHFIDILVKTMQDEPEHWNCYYKDYAKNEIDVLIRYGFSDRCRYYFDKKTVKESFLKLINNINNNYVPQFLVSQFFNEYYIKMKEDNIEKFKAEEVIKYRIKKVLEDYYYAISDCN